MKRLRIQERQAHIYGEAGGADTMIVLPVMERNLTSVEEIYKQTVTRSSNTSFMLAAVAIQDWNAELSIWEAPPVFGNAAFAGNGAELLEWLTGSCILQICRLFRMEKETVRFYIGGYSLAGLFSLWAMYQTELFSGAASCSGSLWFPGFSDYAKEQPLKKDCAIYLSLGDREEKTKNPVMSEVGAVTRELAAFYAVNNKVNRTVLEWNCGNHFKDCDARVVKGLSWLLTERESK